jgi:hypothetical protein
MERIEIPLNRWRIGLYFVGCISLLVGFAYITYDVIIEVKDFSDILMSLGCSCGIVALIFPSILYLHKLFCFNLGLTITEEGIINNAGYTYWGLIEWRDLYSISVNKVSTNYLIYLGIRDHTKFAKRMNPVSAWLVMNSTDGYGMLPSPIINASLLRCNPEELETILKAYLLKYGKKAST